MAWNIHCNQCNQETRAAEITKLLENHRDEQGWFRCATCGSPGYIKKVYEVQNPLEGVWEPYLKGALLPDSEEYGKGYQPFAFLVSYAPDAPPNSVWFCYYKDLRDPCKEGGRLKMGHGPGGPPVFGTGDVLDFLVQMIERGCLDKDEVKGRMKEVLY